MTEDEAKTKWCPFIRKSIGTTSCGNSTINTYTGLYGRQIDDYNCIASDCMLFKWIEDHEIELSNGMVALCDKEDAHIVDRFKWGWHGRYVKSSSGYLHRIIAEYRYGEIPDGMVVDHIDGNPLNNRLGNLRICTQAQNTANAKTRGGKSQYRGVSKNPRGRWYAQISKNGKRQNLGTFDTEKEAAAAYDKAAGEIHGEYAKYNLSDTNNIGRRGYCGLAGKSND